MDNSKSKGRMVNLLDPLTVERAQYTELRSPSGALLGRRLNDGDALYLFITPNNKKSWRMDYRYGKTKRVIVFGRFPAMSLSAARTAKLEAKLILSKGRDPGAEKKQMQEALQNAEEQRKADSKNTFRDVAAEWLEEEDRAKPKSEAWHSNTERWIAKANDAFGNRKLPEIDAADVLRLIKGMAKSTPASAEFCRQTVSRIFNYGIRTLRAPRGFNPAEAVKGAVIVPAKKHHPKLEASELPELLAKIDKYDGPESVKIGLNILLHCFPRRTELVEAPWTEINLDAALWSIPKERMKADRDHVIPLSTQVAGMFRRLRELAEGSEFVFPSKDARRRRKGRPIGEQKFNFALQSLGYKGKFTPHSARSTAASILADRGFDVNVIDAALAHKEKNQTRAAYFRNTYLDQRRALLQAWSDMLDGFAAGGAQILPINAGKAA